MKNKLVQTRPFTLYSKHLDKLYRGPWKWAIMNYPIGEIGVN
jgi:hypothetical protein